MIKNIKGTKDILPDETPIWQYVENQIHLFFKQFGYSEIRTPKFEDTTLFNRSIGEDTDIVSKEMYSWVDQGGNNLTLKPEVTASVARSLIQHKLAHINKINKLYYIDSLFRRERPQKGRFRQFEQFGIEAIGSDHPEQDVEVISMAYYFYEKIGIENLQLKINSIGSQETRKIYKKALYEFLSDSKESLSDVSKKRLSTNPMRILDTKIDFEIEIIKNAPKIIDFLNPRDKEHFDTILNYLDQLNIKYEIDHLLVRGLDYYSRTVFEIQSDLLGSQSALCGGGRYDYLIEELGGKSTPAIGFAAGLERLIISLNKALSIPNNNPDIYIVSIGSKAIEYAVKLAQNLRFQNNLIVVTDTLRQSLKAQMKEANKLKAHHTIIIGDDEIDKKKLIIKNMDSGNQDEIDFEKVESYFK
mgnify:CR=1 FL=1